MQNTSRNCRNNGGRLKQESTRQIWHLHGKILRKQYWYQKILWSDGYFVCSIGEASPMEQYVNTSFHKVNIFQSSWKCNGVSLTSNPRKRWVGFTLHSIKFNTSVHICRHYFNKSFCLSSPGLNTAGVFLFRQFRYSAVPAASVSQGFCFRQC
jgi:hypothetical protein